MAAASVLMGVLVVAYLGWGQMARKVRLPGVVVPQAGMHHITAPQQGVLLALQVAEGQQVERGQPLLTLGTERHLAAGEAHALVQVALDQRRDSLQAELRLISQQHSQRQAAGAERLRSLEAGQRQAALERAALQQRLQLAQAQLQRHRQLQAEGFVSAAQAQSREDELLDLQMRQAGLNRQIHALAQEQRGVAAELQQAEATLQTAQAQVQRALAALEQERVEAEARRAVVLRAPVAGRVTLAALQQGQTAQAGQLLLALQPQTEMQTGKSSNGEPTPAAMQAHLFAPSRAAGFVQPGQTVWLRYAPYPYAKFGLGKGTVLNVSETALSPHELPLLQAQGAVGPMPSAEPVRRITVALAQPYVQAYGQRRALTAGTLLEADVVQDTRAVWEWLFEPLLAARQQVKVLSGGVGLPGDGG